jgi:hypothetical protein
VLLEGEAGIAGETFRVGTQRLQEALHLDADLVVSCHLMFSCPGLSSPKFSGLNYFCVYTPPHPGLHFGPPLPSEPGEASIETLRCLPILPVVKNTLGRD